MIKILKNTAHKFNTSLKILLFTVLMLFGVYLASRIDVLILKCDLGDIFEKKENEKIITRNNGLYDFIKDFSVNDNVITSVGNDPWIYLNTENIEYFKYIKLDVDLLGRENIYSQFFFVPMHGGTGYFNEAESVWQYLNNGINYIRIPVNVKELRLDLTSEEGISLIVNSVELTNKKIPAKLSLLLIIILNVLWCVIWFVIIFKKEQTLSQLDKIILSLSRLTEIFNNKIYYFYTNVVQKTIVNKYISVIISFLKIKIVYSLLCLFISLTALYCIICLVTSDSVGIPFQKTIVFDHKDILNNLQDFEVNENVLWSLSDKGIINLKIDTSSLGKYKYVTILTKRLSDPNSSVGISYSGINTKFRLFEGQNTVKIKNGPWQELSLHIGNRKDMSMVIEKIIISRFPVLSEYFIILYLISSLFILFVWYLIFYKGFYKIIIEKPVILLIFIILIQVLYLIYYIDKKNGYHLDEFTTFTNSNGDQPGYHASTKKNYSNTWNDSKFYKNLITVQPDKLFDFHTIYKRMYRDGITALHPPFHYFLVNAISSFFPNTFSKWYGASINILMFMGVIVLLYLSSVIIFKRKIIALIPCIVYGFSSVALSSFLYIRMYGTLVFFFTALVYLSILLVSEKSKAGLKYCVTLSLVIILGSLTNTLFLLILALSSVFLLIWLLRMKYYLILRNCIITVVVSFGIFHFIWPVWHYSLFNRTHGIQNVSFLVNLIGQIKNQFKNIDIGLLGNPNDNFYKICIILFSMCFIVLIIKNKNISKIIISNYFLLFLISISTLFLIVSNSTYRYNFAIFPTITLCLLLFIYKVLIQINKKCATIIFILFSVFIIANNFNFRNNGNNIFGLYPYVPDINNFISYTNNAKAIFIYDEGARSVVNTHYHAKFNKTYLASIDNYDNALLDIEKGHDLFICLDIRFNQEELLSELKDKIKYDNTIHYYQYHTSHGRGAINLYKVVW